MNQSSGIVYELKNDSIVRIEDSYNDNIHNLSLDFVHRDTLFRFGGYGYFNNNKKSISLNEKTLNYGRIKIELNDKIVEVLSFLLNQE